MNKLIANLFIAPIEKKKKKPQQNYSMSLLIIWATTHQDLSTHL